MGKVIKKSANPGFFAEGGSTKMFGKGGAAPAPAGQNAYESQPGVGAKFAEGGKGHMFGKGHANEMQAGQSAKSSQ
jgi:hypothetical protein